MKKIAWNNRTMLLMYPIVAASFSLFGCATPAPPPIEEMAVSRAAVERATGSSAADAPLELASARDKLDRATAAFANKDFELARRLAEQAEADATLADAKSRSARSGRALNEVREGLTQLRNEMAPK